MPRYFFDVRDGNEVARDELGVELADLHEAMAEAKQSLADISGEAMRSRADSGQIAIVVRSGENVIGSIRMSYELQVNPLPLS